MTVAQALLEAIASNVNDAVTVVDAAGRFVFANDGAARLLGFSSGAELMAADPRAVRDRYQLVDEHERPLDASRLPSARVLLGERPPQMLVGWRAPGSAELRWSTLRSVPLADAQGRLQAVLSLFSDVTEQRRRDAERNAFIALLGHELRNPLAPMVNALHLMKRGGPSDALLAVVERQAAQLGRLVDDMLDSARISHGLVTLQRRALDVGELFEAAAEDHRALFREKGVDLDVRREVRLGVNGDPARLNQVVANLLANALELTPRGGRVEVTARRSGDRAELVVADSGEGFDAPTLANLFRPFARKGREGLGLGLSVVRGLVDLHGGAVTAASPGPGRGATFCVTLPLVEAPAVAEPAVGARRRGLRPLSVLVIDDNVDLANTMRDLLRFDVERVEAEHSGAAALDTIRRLMPDVVICDIGMPEKDGYAIAREVRADPALARVRLIALTGYGLDVDRALAAEAGFARHLTKPVPPDELLRVLDDS